MKSVAGLFVLFLLINLIACTGNRHDSSGDLSATVDFSTCADSKDVRIYRVLSERMFSDTNPVIGSVPTVEEYLVKGKTTVAGMPAVEYAKDLIAVMQDVATGKQWENELAHQMRCGGIFAKDRKIIPADIRYVRDVFKEILPKVINRYQLLVKADRRNTAWRQLIDQSDGLVLETDQIVLTVKDLYFFKDAMVTSVKFDLELKPGFDGIDFDTLPEFQKNPAGIELSDGNGMYIPIVAGKLNLEANKASFIYTFNGLPGDGAKNIKIVLAAGHLGLNMPLTLVIPEGFLLEKDLYIDIATIDG